MLGIHLRNFISIKYYFHGTCIVLILSLNVLILSLLAVEGRPLILVNPPTGTIFLFFVIFLIIPLLCGSVNYLLTKRLWREIALKAGFWLWLNGFYLSLMYGTFQIIVSSLTQLWFIQVVGYLILFPVPMFLGYTGKHIAVKG